MSELFNILESKVEKAIERLKFFTKDKIVFCAFSGGKDSQCCYHLLKEAGIPFTASLAVTRFEPVDVIKFVRENYPDVVFQRNYKRSLVEDVERNGLPSRWARWCCAPKHNQVVPEGSVSVIGIRFQESIRRRNTWRMSGVKQGGELYVCPICDWSEEDVWGYIKSRGIKYCSLYDKGFDRLGCVACPLASQSKRERDIRMYPKNLTPLRMGSDRFVERMKAQNWLTKTGKRPSWTYADDPKEEYWNRWIKTAQTSKSVYDFEHNISKNGNDEKQLCLFAGTGFDNLDAGKTEEEY